MLERGPRFKHTDFKQSMYIGHLSNVYSLIQSTQGTGAQIVVANGVGGGSNLYLAASIRSPRETFERRDHHPDDGPERRMWPKEISRKTLDRYYRRAELALRVERPRWNQVSKSGGLWAATLNAAGYTCDRVPCAIDLELCQNVKWCHTGCIYGAKNTVNTNYLGAAEDAGVSVRPAREVQRVRRSSADGYRYIVEVSVLDWEGDNPSRQPTGADGGDRVQGADPRRWRDGEPADPDALALGPAERCRAALGRHLGINGDHVAAVEYDPKKVREVLGLPRYGQFYKGRPITTMTYDFWHGRRAHRHDGTRFTLQEIFLSSLTNFLYDDGREPSGDPSWWGLQKKRAISTWNNRIELLAMVEDTHDGRFFLDSPTSGGCDTSQRRPGRDRPLRLHAVGGIDACARGGERGDEEDRRAQGARPVHEADRDEGRLRVASARRLPDGRVGGVRRRGPPLRGVRQRGPLLHGLVGDPDLPRREPVADDRGRLRAGRGPPDRARPRARPAAPSGRLQAPHARAAFLGERFVPKKGGGLKVVRG